MPHGMLHIYYVGGCVSAGKSVFGENFIGNWQEADCSFLFFSHPSDGLVASVLAGTPGAVLKDRFVMSYEDWIGGAPQPFEAGGFRVVPPWLPEAGAGGADVIWLDPGVVFGSGTHPTTRDCLDAMEMVCSSVSVKTTLDLGCGTGLLALAAARLGSRRTLAVDRNLLAVETAKNNIAENRLEDSVLAIQGCAEDFIGIGADLVVANIHYDVMKTLVAAPGFSVSKRFVLSGLLRSQADRIEDNLRQGGAGIEHRFVGEGVWHTLVGGFG